MRISDWSSDVCSSDLVDLGLGQRHESPIVRPGIVEDRENDRGLALELRFVDLADDDAIVALARLDDALDDRRKFLGDVEIVGQQFLYGSNPARSIQPRYAGFAWPILPSPEESREGEKVVIE